MIIQQCILSFYNPCNNYKKLTIYSNFLVFSVMQSTMLLWSDCAHYPDQVFFFIEIVAPPSFRLIHWFVYLSITSFFSEFFIVFRRQPKKREFYGLYILFIYPFIWQAIRCVQLEGIAQAGYCEGHSLGSSGSNGRRTERGSTPAVMEAASESHWRRSVLYSR